MNVINLTKQLVAIPSVSGEEAEILDFCQTWLHDNTFTDIIRTEKFCVGKIKGKNPSKALILCGHVDTVSPGNSNAWHTNPIHTVSVNGMLHGLGIGDMKAGVAI